MRIVRISLLVLAVTCAGVAQTPGWTPDPAGDSKGGPDLVSVGAVASNGVLTLRARFGGRNFDPKKTRVVWVLDTDQNPTTGSPGIFGAPGAGAPSGTGTVDADRIGLEAAAVLTGICEGGSVLGYDPQAKTWSLAELLASFALPDGFDAYVPLSSLDKTDSEIHFKVLAYTFSGMCPPQSISLTVQDAAPDVGKPAAVATESRSELVAPQLLSPADGAVLDIVPRKTLLKWSTVPGAVGYLVQVQYQDPSGDPTGPGGWRPMVFRRTPDTAAEFDFVGAQTGRWRVWPIDANGLAGQARGWLSFRYLR